METATIDSPEQNSRASRSLLLVFSAVLIWSTGGLFIKLTELNAYEVTFFRSLFAGLTVTLVTYREGLKLNLFGVFTSVIYALLLFLFVWATKKTSAANAIFLQYTAPVYILLLGPLLIGEKFRFRDLFVVVVVLAGMALFFVGKLEINEYEGNIAALISGLFLGLYLLLLKHPAAKGFNPAIAVIYGNFLLALLNASSGIPAVTKMILADWLSVIYLGVIQIGISYVLFIKGVQGGTRPLDASLIGFFEPLLNPVWVFLFIGEKPSGWAIIGGLTIITAVALHTLSQYKGRLRLSA
jgi:drug/metabolite transporter (DMT)-like permease